jgi:hypothetical protein
VRSSVKLSNATVPAARADAANHFNASDRGRGRSFSRGCNVLVREFFKLFLARATCVHIDAEAVAFISSLS